MAKKTVKEFIQEHKKGLLLTTGLVVGTVIGGTVVYVLTRDARGLVDNLKAFGVDNHGTSWLTERIKQYADKSNAVFYANSSSDKPFTIRELGDMAGVVINDAGGLDMLDDEVVGMLAFVKRG